MKRNALSLLFAVAFLFSIIPFKASASTQTYTCYEWYDFNGTGELDQGDLYILETLILAGETHYGVLDLVIAYQIFFDEVVGVEVSEHRFYSQTAYDEDKLNEIVQYWRSDYPKNVIVSDGSVKFEFLRHEGKMTMLFVRIYDLPLGRFMIGSYLLPDGKRVCLYDNCTVTVQ